MSRNNHHKKTAKCKNAGSNWSRKRSRDGESWAVKKGLREPKSSSSCDQKQEHIPWAEKYAPQNQGELAVHKKKIAEVEEWLRMHMNQRLPTNGQDAQIMLLSGPCGIGKTATLQVLAKEMRAEVQEWVNPIPDAFEKDDLFPNRDYSNLPKYESQVTKFQNFLLRANRYHCLQLDDIYYDKKVILVEDIPNKFYRDHQALHTVLQKFAKTTRTPLVFIISDSIASESSVHKIFSKDIMSSLGIHQISFNPIAPTSMVKALSRIATLESTKVNHKFPLPSKSTIEAIAHASSGDIRSAINALQFACLKDTKDLNEVLHYEKPVSSSSKSNSKSRTLKDFKSKNSKKNYSEMNQSEETLSAIGGKDTSLFLFRALGKILYCKRNPRPISAPRLPPHLSHHERDPLKFFPEEVIEKTHMLSEHFILYLHQNYLDFYEELDDVVEAAHCYSDADYLSCSWEHRSILNKYSSSVVARGLAHYNSSKKFHDSSSSKGGGWRPLHKPQWFEVNVKYRDRCASAKGLLGGYSCTPVALQTQLIPYLALLKTPLSNPGQISFVQELGRFPSHQSISRGFPQKLDEKDIDEDDVDEDLIPSSQTKVGNKPEVIDEQTDSLAEEEHEDEVIIEDFDD